MKTTRAKLLTGKLRGALIAIEVALSFVLLTGAGLMMKSLIRLWDVEVGFHTQRLLTMNVSLSGTKYSSPQKKAAFVGQVLWQLKSLPLVRSAAVVTNLPLTRDDTQNSFEIPGRHAVRGSADYNVVSAGYFRTMGIPLLSGRELLNSDSAHTPLVCVISRRMAQRYWPHQNPVGAGIVAYRVVAKSTHKGTSVEFTPQQLRVVGVVGDVRQLGLDAPIEPELYMTYAQWPSSNMWLVARTRTDPSLLVPAVRKAVWNIDPDQPVADANTMDQWLSKETASRRFMLQLIGTFAFMALVLAAVGTYGVVAYGVGQRTHEIGIRMALGATEQRILWTVISQTVRWLITGIAAGIVGAFGITRLLGHYLYEVQPSDPQTFIGVLLVLLGIALVAIYIPARQAARVDPIVALHYE